MDKFVKRYFRRLFSSVFVYIWLGIYNREKLSWYFVYWLSLPIQHSDVSINDPKYLRCFSNYPLHLSTQGCRRVNTPWRTRWKRMIRQWQMFQSDNMAAARYTSWKTHVRFCVWSINFVALRRTCHSRLLSFHCHRRWLKNIPLFSPSPSTSYLRARERFSKLDSHCTAVCSRAVLTYRCLKRVGRIIVDSCSGRGWRSQQPVELGSLKGTRRKIFITPDATCTSVFIKRSKMQFRCSLWLEKGGWVVLAVKCTYASSPGPSLSWRKKVR